MDAAMKNSLISAAVLLLISGAVSAQSANDAGVAVTGGGRSLIGPVVPAGPGLTCAPVGPVVSAFTGGTTQSGRIFRDGIANTCANKPYPGIFNAGTTYNYETFTYGNTGTAPSCVTINFDPDAGAAPCGTNAHASAYSTSYDPGNQGTNFLGDVGSSVAQPFSFTIPAGESLVLAVTNTSAADTCSFAFEVVDLPCVVAPPIPAPVNSPLAMILLGLALAGFGGLVVARRD
jgi:hypothetical protein